MEIVRTIKGGMMTVKEPLRSETLKKKKVMERDNCSKRDREHDPTPPRK